MFKKLVLGLVALGALALMAGPAFAHVSVDPPEASQGGSAVLTFKVPNETVDANTISVEVNFPTDHPIADVSVQPKTGWTYTVATKKLDTPITSDEGDEVTEAVSSITWTGGTIKPGEYDEFKISAGPLPDDADELLFPTIQTYDNGDVVRWIEKTPASGEEPENPVPVLKLTAATGDGKTSDTSDLATTSDVDSVKTLAVIGMVLAGIAIVLGIIAFARKGAGSS
jgi:uncharacterized protein YcnI